MTDRILWYLHDQGRGHLARARAVIPQLDAAVVVAAGPQIFEPARCSLDAPVVCLPTDVPARARPTRGPWHHAPVSAEVRRRSIALAETIERYSCTTAVVDVSMEVTVLARLFGLRTITVRQSGVRTDPAHQLGFTSADMVWVPQHEALEPISEPTDERWRFTGPFSRFDRFDRFERTTTMPPPRSPSPPPEQTLRMALLMVGSGGSDLPVDQWRQAEVPCGWHAVIAGAAPTWRGDRVCSVGYVDDIHQLLTNADVVVCSAGWATVADAVAARARLVIVAERRPFAEQETRAAALHAAGLAVARVGWPSPSDLPELLDVAARLDPACWRPYHDGLGATRAAAMIDEVHAA